MNIIHITQLLSHLTNDPTHASSINWTILRRTVFNDHQLRLLPLGLKTSDENTQTTEILNAFYLPSQSGS
ncbi:hypothetical protein MJO29_001570 [Puccinia striiformis f. sp. tritici]|uniref:hypothetical protein n=1 Tax=Puccinia striiformis f. sp. tritici TaxID=168172 RepID=UPI0020085C53|nr:hypothetical protein Pst134EA_003211 [Puccinia striiformis f. sp. tritici]KAH9472604.1 hypothetical protein Pst134EA_003211 [Puccinia striiformis f. sp. tritici]KAI7965822.1 hypothetical protein MJO29_001570 [Puccinia striiformis f. sp. tritici]KAI9611377.1 hypothetical protein H4Q26_008327 [Puccinia striiformis f. sp. tritici PST-130]